MINALMHESMSLCATGTFLGHESLSVVIDDLMIVVIRSDEDQTPPKSQFFPLVYAR